MYHANNKPKKFGVTILILYYINIYRCQGQGVLPKIIHLIKDIYENLTVNVVLGGKGLSVFPLRLDTGQRYPILML